MTHIVFVTICFCIFITIRDKLFLAVFILVVEMDLLFVFRQNIDGMQMCGWQTCSHHCLLLWLMTVIISNYLERVEESIVSTTTFSQNLPGDVSGVYNRHRGWCNGQFSVKSCRNQVVSKQEGHESWGISWYLENRRFSKNCSIFMGASFLFIYLFLNGCVLALDKIGVLLIICEIKSVI